LITDPHGNDPSAFVEFELGENWAHPPEPGPAGGDSTPPFGGDPLYMGPLLRSLKRMSASLDRERQKNLQLEMEIIKLKKQKRKKAT
jgi:hypothetical protein